MANITGFPPNLLPGDGNPDWMNKADNAWQLVAATLVGLQIVPGLIILYGGAVKKKWAVNSAFMSLYAFACVFFCWVVILSIFVWFSIAQMGRDGKKRGTRADGSPRMQNPREAQASRGY